MSSFGLFIRLYWEFFKVGLFSIGGGMATLPFLAEMADHTGWFTRADLANMVAVAESTPGPIGINTATYVGYATAGLFGGAVSTLGIITPSIIIILLIAKILTKFKDSKIVNSIFYFIRPASLALIFCALVSLLEMAFITRTPKNVMLSFNFIGLIFAAALIILTNLVKKTKKMHPIIWIGFGALFGILIM